MMNRKVLIRRARRYDLSNMVMLENRSFAFDLFTRAQYRYLIARANSSAFVLLAGRRLAGSAIVLWRKNSRKAHLYSIAVDPEFQGRGFGARLLEKCMREARRRGCDRFSLEVRADNHKAIALYQNSGFEITARIKRYYEDGCDAIRMEVALQNSSTPVKAAGPKRRLGPRLRPIRV